MPDIGLFLGKPVPCPNGCKGMVLKTDRDRERGYCEFCAMTRYRKEATLPVGAEKLGIWKHRRRPTYRTEADAYGEGIEDDD